MNERSARKALLLFGIRAQGVQELHRRDSRVVWQVTDAHHAYALKWVLERGIARKIAAATDFLRTAGVSVPPLVRALDGKPLACDKKGCFLLFQWIPSRRPRYDDDDPDMIPRMATLLAQFHLASRGYVATGASLWGNRLDWPADYANEIPLFKRFGQMARRSNDPFSRLFREHYSWLQARIAWVCDSLRGTAYDALVEAAYRDPLLGHGDYSRSNLLLDDQGNLSIIDLDSLGIALPISDISRFIPLIDHDLQNWSEGRFRLILDSYQQTRPISEAELELLRLDQVFPHQLLRLAKSYYEHRWGPPSATLLDELERCFRTDHDKLVSLGVGPR